MTKLQQPLKICFQNYSNLKLQYPLSSNRANGRFELNAFYDT